MSDGQDNTRPPVNAIFTFFEAEQDNSLPVAPIEPTINTLSTHGLEHLACQIDNGFTDHAAHLTFESSAQKVLRFGAGVT